MKLDNNLKFEDYPLNVPTEKRTLKKIEALVNELEECGSFLTAKPVIKRYYKLYNELATDISVIQVRYTLDTRNPTYQKAQETLDELLPLIRQYFPISDDRKDIGVGGSSMGVIFALSLIASYPEIFGFSLVFSPGLFLYPVKKVKEFLDEAIPKFDDHKMYFYCGNVGFESKFLKRTVDTFNYLKSHGMNHNNIHLLVDPNADHNEASWSKHFEQGIKFWFKR